MKKIVIEQSKTIRERVYDHLKKAIFLGEYRPGERLVEAEIGKNIGTSRTPVREALHALEREKLVTAIPRVGYVVKQLSKKELDELTEIRLVLEALALRLALKNDAEGLATELRKNIEKAEQLLPDGDTSLFFEMDYHFHETISRFAASERLQELTQSIRQYMVQYQISSLYDYENIKRAISGHKNVLECIEKLDQSGAQQALNNHLNQSRKDIAFYAKIEDS